MTTKTTKKSSEPTGPDYIERSLWPMLVRIDQVFEDPSNVREHPARSVEAIAASLRRFKQQKVIVIDARGKVIAGNGTLAAAKSLGWEFIAAQRSETLSASSVESTAFGIADNRSQEHSLFEEQGLRDVLESLQEDGVALSDLGWTDDEFATLLKNLEGPTAPDDFKEYGDDLNTDFKCPSCGYEWSGSTS